MITPAKFEMSPKLKQMFARYQKLSESRDIADEEKIEALGMAILEQIQLEKHDNASRDSRLSSQT